MPAVMVLNKVEGTVCPTNGKLGKPVNSLTLKALLNRPLTELRNTNYRFCPDPACPTVYYSEDGMHLLSESDLRERVYQKHPHADDILVCYCFQHTLGALRRDAAIHSTSTVAAEIAAGIKAEQCACDIRNPQGTCCLGNVNAYLKSAYSKRHPS